MVNLEEKMNQEYKKRIANYLVERCKTDTCLALACMKDNKSLDGTIAYIKSEAKKQAQDGCACIPDEEVFGWAVHYILEDSLSSSFEPKPKQVVKEVVKKETVIVPKPTIAEEVKTLQLTFDF